MSRPIFGLWKSTSFHKWIFIRHLVYLKRFLHRIFRTHRKNGKFSKALGGAIFEQTTLLYAYGIRYLKMNWNWSPLVWMHKNRMNEKRERVIVVMKMIATREWRSRPPNCLLMKRWICVMNLMAHRRKFQFNYKLDCTAITDIGVTFVRASDKQNVPRARHPLAYICAAHSTYSPCETKQRKLRVRLTIHSLIQIKFPAQFFSFFSFSSSRRTKQVLR